jgi:GABA permease
VVLIALLSAMNANIYGSSRMAFSLVGRGLGPKGLAKVSGGVPRRSVLASSSFGFVAVLLNFWWPDTVFHWLLNMVGAAVLVVWGFTCVAQLRMRARLEREEPARLSVRMWGFPWLTWATLVAVATILALMLRDQADRVQLAATAALALALSAAGWLRQHRSGGAAA